MFESELPIDRFHGQKVSQPMYPEFPNRRIAKTINQQRISPPRMIRGNGESTRVSVSRSLDRRIQVVVTLLESNSHQQIGIGEMARLVNLSPGRLAHLFKSEMELSLQQYLTQLRLAKAKSQLESSFLSIKEIAASVGFSSVARFVVCFKHLVGDTPAQYRKHFHNASHRGAEITFSKISKEIAESRTK
jgi:transcriptional regulator GlxA family with amidase domain